MKESILGLCLIVVSVQRSYAQNNSNTTTKRLKQPSFKQPKKYNS